MMTIEKRIYFIYKHPEIVELQDDGLAMVKRLGEDEHGEILFYSSEEDALFSSFENLSQSLVRENFQIRPATLPEICSAGLSEYVDTIAEWTIENGSLKQISRIHLRMRE